MGSMGAIYTGTIRGSVGGAYRGNIIIRLGDVSTCTITCRI